ncbi:cyclin-like protein interacting with PHO85 [Saxophila tyrrhenica]|uniref:Cyclin-like protein interacting with PHO85 n=1 Tax=Saxophila tyrrhenica TaxID=1690608 RepID=A0AAV9PLJ7_9PEZI|nr:cyclin-like protein interacting with PHO85 [Saxophila tyrrhenica]
MSVVLDAVNNFFGPSHSQFAYHEAPRAHDTEPPPKKRSRTPTRSDTPMSASRQRASSSSTSRTAQEQNVPSQQTSRTPAQTSEQSATEAPEPPLAPVSAPPSEALQPAAEGQHTPTAQTADARQGRPAKIKVRDLEHIQSFATQDMGAFSEISSRSQSRSRGQQDEAPQYEISDMKVEHIIEMVAGLLTKITTTNDQQHEHLHRQPPAMDGAAHLNPTTNSVLAFHGKNVPSITILSYLSRIHKYCPTSYEVFLSLLVYFDRMTERVNAGPMQSLRQANEAALEQDRSAGGSSESLTDQMEGVTATTPQGTQTATPPASGGLEKGQHDGRPGTPHSRSYQPDSPSIPQEPTADPYNLSHFFVVDSFNIHRLVIAGVTCASKFFSDIFYTNSRYAKVGGLPLPELNHLELQFLLLNDFRLSIPVEEIEAYGTMLVEFYAREVVAQQRAAQAQAMQARSLSESSSDSTSTVRAVA